MQWRLIGLPWRTKPRLLCERALKTESETGAKNEFTFCVGSPIEKTDNARVTNVYKSNKLSETLECFLRTLSNFYHSLKLHYSTNTHCLLKKLQKLPITSYRAPAHFLPKYTVFFLSEAQNPASLYSKNNMIKLITGETIS